MGRERLAHTVLRRDTLLKTSEHRWQSTEFPCPARDTGCAILERRGWSPTLGFGPTVTSHDRCLATRPSGQGTQEGARLDLIRFGGHLPKGGYDVQTDGRHTKATFASPVH
jgi:hypothetical protein